MTFEAPDIRCPCCDNSYCLYRVGKEFQFNSAQLGTCFFKYFMLANSLVVAWVRNLAASVSHHRLGSIPTQSTWSLFG